MNGKKGRGSFKKQKSFLAAVIIFFLAILSLRDLKLQSVHQYEQEKQQVAEELELAEPSANNGLIQEGTGEAAGAARGTRLAGTTGSGGSSEIKSGIAPRGSSLKTKSGRAIRDDSSDKKPQDASGGGFSETKSDTATRGDSSDKKPGAATSGDSSKTKSGMATSGGSSETKPGTTTSDNSSDKKPGKATGGDSSETKSGTGTNGDFSETKSDATASDGSSETKSDTTASGGSSETKPDTATSDGFSETKSGTGTSGGSSEKKPGVTARAESSEKSTTATDAPDKTPISYIRCKIEVRCSTLSADINQADAGIRSYIPKDGVILNQTEVKVAKGTTAYELLSKVCQAKGIALDASFTPMYHTYYVRGIAHIYEKQAGKMSGWIYKINGKSPNRGASSYVLSDQDVCSWCYTCDGKTS